MPIDSRIARRLVIIGGCALSLAVCCGLAWWQWERYSSAGGSFQNLGYVLQWPLFGLFPAFVVWRIRRLGRRAAERDAVEQGGTERGDAAGTDTMRSGRTARSVAGDVPLPGRSAVAGGSAADEEDAELAAYNRYLAELHARDQQRS